MNIQKFIDRSIKDKQGKINLFQMPNVPLIGWMAFKLATYLPFSDAFKEGFSFTSTAFLFAWAYLEITSGVNYARRALGAIVMALILIPKFL